VRKAVIISLAFLILTSSVGVTISRHFCGDELKHVAFNSKPDKCCEMDMPTCHDVTDHYGIEDEFQLTKFKINFIQSFVFIDDFTFVLHKVVESPVLGFAHIIKKPPLDRPKIYIEVESLLI